ncbi:MAG: hypothetical protein ABID04_00210 [Patescibacteria group bacterium]
MNKIVAVYGPTTSNKLGLVLKLAEYLWGKYKIEAEAINVDSRKIYREFVVSQGYPNEEFKKKVKTHLFGVVSAQKPVDLLDFKKMVDRQIDEVYQRDNLPILISGSMTPLSAILKNYSARDRLVFNLMVNKSKLGRSIHQNVLLMSKNGLYKEFRQLFMDSSSGEISPQLLEEALGYRQFLTVAKEKKKSPLSLNPDEIDQARRYLEEEVRDYARQQIVSTKEFPGMISVKGFPKAKQKLDSFLGRQKS